MVDDLDLIFSLVNLIVTGLNLDIVSVNNDSSLGWKWSYVLEGLDVFVSASLDSNVGLLVDFL